MPIQDWRELRYQLDNKQKGFTDSTKAGQDDFSVDDLSLEDWRLIDQSIEDRNNRRGADRREAIIQAGNDYSQYVRDLTELQDTGYGDYRKDKEVPFEEWIKDPVNYRANSQTAAAKIVNGAVKGGITAATTFADNTVGLLAGLINIGVDAVDGNGFKPVDSFINNRFSRDLQSVRDEAEEALPNYRTQQELDDADEWWKHINANFIGDVFLKNLGFTIGAGLSGGLYAKGFQALQRANVINKAHKLAALGAIEGASEETIANTVREAMLANPKMGNKILNDYLKANKNINAYSQLIGGLTGAAGEARVEAMQAAKEFYDPAALAARQNYELRKQELIDEFNNPDNGYLVGQPVYDGYGKQIDSIPVLSKEGEDAYNLRLKDLQDSYAEEMAALNREAYKVATRTFGWNIPLLTGSNIVMFGRMFSGGYGTQARYKIKGNPGEYVGKGSIAGNIANGIGKSLSEGGEEFMQKVISEDTKNRSEKNIAAFHNGKYDPFATRSISEWISDFGNSVEQAVGTFGNTVQDPQAWEEFAIGALTGALSHAATGGIRADIQDRKDNQDAADRLNARLADPKFKTLWGGMVRHNSFEQEKDEALNNNNSFAWHSANDKQLLNDVMMFADIDRLDDLQDMVSSFADIKPEEIESSNLIDDSDPEFKTKTPEQKAEWVKKRAADINKTIEQYRNIREAFDFPSFGVAMDTEAMNELIYTQATLLNMADRYDSVLNEALSKITPVIESKSKETTAEGEPTVAAIEASGLLTDIPDLKNVFLGYSQTAQKKIGELPTVYLMDDKKLEAVHNRIDDLIKLTPDEETKNNLKDLHKIINTGKTFYERLYSPEFKKTFAEQFEKQAKTDQKAAEELKEQVEEKKVNEAMNALEAETGGMATVEQMHRAYDAAPDKEAFMKGMVQKAETDEEADRYVKLRKTYEDFRDALKAKHPELVVKRTGQFNDLGEVMLHDIINSTTNVEQFLKDGDNIAIPLKERVDSEIQDLAREDSKYQGYVETPTAVNEFYNKFSMAIRDTFPEFRKQVISAAGKENIVQAVEEGKKAKPVVSEEENPAPTVVPEVTPAVESKPAPAAEPEPKATPEEKAEEAEKEPKPEPISNPDFKEVVGDSMSSYQDTGLTEEQGRRVDYKGSVKSGFYQKTIPEIGLTPIKSARDIIQARKTADRETMELLDEEYATLDLSNFVQFDEKNNAKGKGVTDEFDYAKDYKYLQDNDAFEHASLDVNPNDEIVFAILPDAPLSPEGQKQIVWGTVKSRNADGEITAIQPIDFLHSRDKAGKYMNLDELYDAIQNDYESTDPDSLYIFGGRKNPKTSKIFQRRPGIVRYDRSNTQGTKLDQIPSYREDAPIMVMDESNRPVLLRGKAEESNIFMPNIYEWSSSHDGRLYYLARGGSDRKGNPTYTPIFVRKMPITSEKVMSQSNKFLRDINDGLNRIDEIGSKVTPENLEQSNKQLRGQIGGIIDKINLDGISFEYALGLENNPVLNVSWGDAESENMSIPAGQSIFQVLDRIQRPARLSYNPKWVDATKKNLQDIIDADLLHSDAQELRQVEVNLWYDPWNPATGTFERILPEQVTGEPMKEIPKAEPQHVATEPKPEKTESEVQKPEGFEYTEVNPRSVQIADDLDDSFDTIAPESLDYGELDEEAKSKLENNGYTQEDWDSESDENMRRHMLNC